MNCAVCGAGMAGPRHGFYYCCAACGFMASNLQPQLDDAAAHAALDETTRLEGLRQLRADNFRRILDALQPLRPDERPALLDVGCAHGWFLREAAGRGYEVTGLEPDSAVLELAGTRDFPIVNGLFPQDVPAGRTFDVITFNDVFEHLPQPSSIAGACHRLLRPGGLLVISLPNSKGFLFGLARLLAKVGVTAPLHRFWQRGFPSPHLTYFHPAALARLLAREGFEEVAHGDLPSVSLRGLWQRMRSDQKASLAASVANWAALVLLSPALRLLPSDSTFQVFRRVEPQGQRL